MERWLTPAHTAWTGPAVPVPSVTALPAVLNALEWYYCDN